MKHFIQWAVRSMAAAAICLGFASCSDESAGGNSGSSGLNAAMTGILTQYVNSTVVPTYTRLSDASIVLRDACQTLYLHKENGTATTQEVQTACDAWLAARKYWEQSEAFLLGPATVRGIDPHIDSWPLDKTQLDALLSSPAIMAQMDADYITSNYGSGGVCGFHALEYIIFADGAAKDVQRITTDEAKYAAAVAGDLAAQCVYLEAAWAGQDNITDPVKIDLLGEDGVDADTDNWGSQFVNAGQAGSRYRTQLEAIVDFIKADKGCYGIANEVGDTKISDPVNSGNVLDVESWFSFNSKTDFQDNIRGIQNVIMGGVSDKRDESKSVYALLKQHNPTLAEELKTAIETCIGEDGTTGLGTIIYPFRDHLTPAENQEAIRSCQALRDKLMEVATYMQQTEF